MHDHIITFLKKSNGYLSGEEISRQLKISRSAIWKNIHQLRQEGYDIVAIPHLGYRLAGLPDKLLPREIQFQLKTKVLGREIVYLDSTTSTMDAAFRLGFEGAREGTVVAAEHQTKGKGRMGRVWCSPKGQGIYLSVILRPSVPASETAQLTLLSAVAVSEAIKKAAGIQTSIKWPNDLLIQGKKTAGILTELSAEMDRVHFVVIGIGINVNTPLSALPPQATSLKHETRREISRVELVQEVLRFLDAWYGRLNKEGFLPIVRRWKELSLTLGHRVRVADSDGFVEGEAIDLDEHGGLVLRNDSGMRLQRMSGDVVFVR